MCQRPPIHSFSTYRPRRNVLLPLLLRSRLQSTRLHRPCLLRAAPALNRPLPAYLSPKSTLLTRSLPRIASRQRSLNLRWCSDREPDYGYDLSSLFRWGMFHRRGVCGESLCSALFWCLGLEPTTASHGIVAFPGFQLGILAEVFIWLIRFRCAIAILLIRFWSVVAVIVNFLKMRSLIRIAFLGFNFTIIGDSRWD